MEEGALDTPWPGTAAAEVGVVALPLAGQRDVQGVVDVVVPLGVEPVAAGLARGDQPRVVEVGLGDQRQRPAEVGRQRLDLDRQLLEQVRRGRSSSACTASSRSPSTW